ncbi:MAG: 50S ribosomal protein L2 [Thiotrichales bacterium]|nr:MAG: 50S ribosomal protein L2 [Thiotrichales bacterium]
MEKVNPTSPGRRFTVKVVCPYRPGKVFTKEEQAIAKAKKSLTRSKQNSSGRNNLGRITVRHKGGRGRIKYRQVDFKRAKQGVPAVVKTIEYDPNRTAYIALICYSDGEWSYIIAPKGLCIGDTVISGVDAEIEVGNCLPLYNIPAGTIVHAVEMHPGRGAQLARCAGARVQLLSKEDKYAILRLRSGETRKVLLNCCATVGEVSNSEHALRCLGKAGAKRWRGIRPTVRGVAMNPVDHPHGGGEGRTSGGRHPVSPWGQPTKGYKTRCKKKSNKMILRSRHSK